MTLACYPAPLPRALLYVLGDVAKCPLELTLDVPASTYVLRCPSHDVEIQRVTARTLEAAVADVDLTMATGASARCLQDLLRPTWTHLWGGGA